MQNQSMKKALQEVFDLKDQKSLSDEVIERIAVENNVPSIDLAQAYMNRSLDLCK